MEITLLSAIGLLSAVVLLIGLSVYALQSTKGLVRWNRPVRKLKKMLCSWCWGGEAEVSYVTITVHQPRLD